MNMKKFVLQKEYQRMKISDYLIQVQNYSGRGLRRIEIYLNGKKVKFTKKLPSSGILYVKENIKESNLIPIKMDLDIIYEDNDLLILNKPPFLLTHPTLKKVSQTLANGIRYYFQEQHETESIPRFYNRLDMNTSGLIIIAKNGYCQAFLQNHSIVTKKYMALVDGIIDEAIEYKNNNEIVIEKPIYRDGENLRRIIDERGQFAKTVVRIIKRFPELNTTLVECELFTGRTHQIRVHLLSLGYPILGDELYYNEIKKNDNRISRQMLHAYKISFMHPTKKEIIHLEIPMYKDMAEFLAIK